MKLSNREGPSLELLRIACQLAEREGFYVVDAVARKSGSRVRFSVALDREGGLSSGDCESFSRMLTLHIEVEGLSKKGYILDVSSPGLERELTTHRELEWAVGKRVRAVLTDGSVLAGMLERLEEESLVVVGETVNTDLVSRIRLDEV